MNKIKIYKGGLFLFELEGYFVPNVGERICFDNTVQGFEDYEVEARLIDLDKERKRFTVTLMVK